MFWGGVYEIVDDLDLVFFAIYLPHIVTVRVNRSPRLMNHLQARGHHGHACPTLRFTLPL